MTKARKKPSFTMKQRKFIEAYLTNGGHGTNAALTAGYSEANAPVAASENLRNPKIAAEIQARMRSLVMSTDEALYRLSAYGRGDLGDFIGMTESEIAQHPQSFLLKNLTITRTTRTNRKGDEDTTTEHIRYELHDPQTAMNTVIKYHQLANKAGQAGQLLNELPMLDELLNRMLAAGMNPEEVFNKMLGKLRVEQGTLEDGR